jgi:hypothetical protein
MIARIEDAVHYAERRRDLLKDAFRLEVEEAEIKAAIASEIDEETQKPRFSNDAKREAEYYRRTAGDQRSELVKIDAGFEGDMLRINLAFADSEKGAGA